MSTSQNSSSTDLTAQELSGIIRDALNQLLDNPGATSVERYEDPLNGASCQIVVDIPQHYLAKYPRPTRGNVAFSLCKDSRNRWILLDYTQNATPKRDAGFLFLEHPMGYALEIALRLRQLEVEYKNAHP